MNNTTDKLSYLKCIILALAPVLGIYHFLPGLSLGFFLLLIFIPIDIVLNKPRILIDLPLLGLIGVFIIINLLGFPFNYSHTNQVSFFNNISFLFLFLFVALYYLTTNLNVKYFINCLLMIGVVASAIIYIQTFYVFFKFQGISFLLPLETDLVDNFDSIQANFRPNSIFQEPAHFSIFLVPLFYYTMQKSKFYLAAFFLFSLFLSTSTYGILASLIVLSLFVLNDKKGFLLLFVLLLSVGVLLFVFWDIVVFMVERNMEKTEDTVNASDNARLMGGISSIAKMDFFQYFFGVGYNQLQSFMELNFLPDPSNYSNSFLFSFYSSGIFGLVSLTVYVINLFKKVEFKMYVILFCLTLLTDQILFNINFFYLIIVIKFFNENQKEVLLENNNLFKINSI